MINFSSLIHIHNLTVHEHGGVFLIGINHSGWISANKMPLKHNKIRIIFIINNYADLIPFFIYEYFRHTKNPSDRILSTIIPFRFYVPREISTNG